MLRELTHWRSEEALSVVVGPSLGRPVAQHPRPRYRSRRPFHVPLPPDGSRAKNAAKLGVAGVAHAHPSGSVWPPPAIAQEQCAAYH